MSTFEAVTVLVQVNGGPVDVCDAPIEAMNGEDMAAPLGIAFVHHPSTPSTRFRYRLVVISLYESRRHRCPGRKTKTHNARM
jgi:hypothetical protein